MNFITIFLVYLHLLNVALQWSNLHTLLTDSLFTPQQILKACPESVLTRFPNLTVLSLFDIYRTSV
jgi:hypothetical protein